MVKINSSQSSLCARSTLHYIVAQRRYVLHWTLQHLAGTLIHLGLLHDHLNCTVKQNNVNIITMCYLLFIQNCSKIY